MTVYELHQFTSKWIDNGYDKFIVGIREEYNTFYITISEVKFVDEKEIKPL